jgi:zinc transporter ZupT
MCWTAVKIMFLPISLFIIGHSQTWQPGALSVILTGWLPLYIGISITVIGRWLTDRAINFFLYIALGLMLFLFTSTCTTILRMEDALSQGLRFTVFSIGFFIGVMILFFYNAIKKAVIKGPMDTAMIGEFSQKVFLLDQNPAGEKRRDIYSLSYAIALGIGLHGAGEGLLISHLAKTGFAEGGKIQLLAVFIHKIAEGFGITAPIARSPFHSGRFILLGAIAGLPLLAGFWVGEEVKSTLFSFFLLSLSAGTILYGTIMLAEMVYMTHRADTNPIFPFLCIIMSFCLFFGLHLMS